MANSKNSIEKLLDKNLEFKSFLIAFTEGSSRGRKLINILTITCIAALLGVFNSLKSAWNWFPSRQDKIRELTHITIFEDDATEKNAYTKVFYYKKDSHHNVDTLQNKFTTTTYCALLSSLLEEDLPDDLKSVDTTKVKPWVYLRLPEYVIDTSKTLNIKKLKQFKANIINAYKIFCIAGFSSRYELNRHLQNMDRAKMENSTFVRVPILGIAFDVNWLIVVSGISFIVIYFLLYYALSRERKNITLLFRIAEKEEISKARLYQFMSMQQVFTIPPSIDEALDDNDKNDFLTDRWPNKVKRSLPRVVWCAPLVVWAFIFWYDYNTRAIGEIINPFLLTTQMVISLLLGVALIYLAFLCIRESLQIDGGWKEEAKKIFEERNERNDGNRTVDEQGDS